MATKEEKALYRKIRDLVNPVREVRISQFSGRQITHRGFLIEYNEVRKNFRRIKFAWASLEQWNDLVGLKAELDVKFAEAGISGMILSHGPAETLICGRGEFLMYVVKVQLGATLHNCQLNKELS